MRIAPIDVAHKSFNKKMMGFDPQEVSEFLQSVAETLEDLTRERNHLREELREKEMSVLEYKDRDQVLKSTISTATQMAEKMRQESEREGKLIIADANQKAEVIVRDARDSLKKIYQEISDLKKVRMQFEANLKAMTQAHLTLLEQGDRYMPQPTLPQFSMNGSQFEPSLSRAPAAAGGPKE